MIVADSDKPGREHAEQVQAALVGTAGSVRIVEPAEGKDARDHLQAGRTVDEFVTAGSQAPPSGSTPDRYKDRRVDVAALLAEPDTPIPWRCSRFAADGYLTVFAGRGGEGKSWAGARARARRINRDTARRNRLHEGPGVDLRR